MSTSIVSVCRPARIALALLVITQAAGAAEKPRALTEDQRIRHTLDRIGFGPRPGDVERVRKIGLDRYIDQQLHPESIPDPRVDSFLRGLRSLDTRPEQMTRAAWDASRVAAASQEGQRTAEERRQAQRQYQAFQARIIGELQQARIARAVESERQLLEVMVDFWSNHFNIDVRKGSVRALKAVDDREVVRMHALGKFRDLLGASAKSPAMLLYLDNAMSSAPLPAARPGRPGRRGRGGLNENYARELMELHTLGVDGGYTQEDVVEVARCFTGWTVDPRTGRFLFAPRRHDNGAKSVLGRTIAAGGGIADGERVLDILSAHPSTARHIVRKLCVRFVSDDPPASVVKAAEREFLRTEGDIRSVVRVIVRSREFRSPEAYRSKVKSPFEFTVSAVRAVDGHIRMARTGGRPAQAARQARGGGPLAQRVASMGQPLFQYQAPTGYPEDSRQWVTAGSLVSRLNFALDLAAGRMPGVSLPARPPDSMEATPAEAYRRAEKAVLQVEASPATRDAVLRQLEAGATAPDGTLATALLLGSPDFQRH